MWRCCRQQPLSAYDQSVAIAAPRSFSASQSCRRRVNLQCPPSRRLCVFICCHGAVIAFWMDLAWQGVSSFIFWCIILSWACLWSLLRATYWTDKGALKGEKRQSIGWDAEPRSGVLRCAHQLHPEAELLKRRVRQAALLQLDDFSSLRKSKSDT